MPEDTAVEILVRPSAMLAAALGIFHALAAGGVLIVALPGIAKALIIALLGASAAHCFRRHAFLVDKNACVGLRLRANGECELRLASGATQSATVLPDWFASSALVVLNARPHPGRRTRAVVLAPDSSDREALRRLRVFLRFRLASEPGR